MKIENRGRYIVCKSCKFKFKFTNKDDRLKWINNKFICPNCEALYCNKPDPEPALFILQDAYLINREEEILNQMYNILVSYGTSLFFKMFKNTSINTYQSRYYVENAISLFIEEYYFVKKNYKVNASFAGILMLKLKQAIYSKKEKLICGISLDYRLPDDNEVQYEDKRNYFQSIENECDKYYLITNLYKLIIQISNYSTTPLENYLRELALYIHLKKGEKYADRFFKLYKSYCPEGKIIYSYTLDILKQRLKKELEGDI